MQDMHAIAGGGGGGGGRVFGDRRLRVHHQQNQALKCPRCDSLNTKFCYYNNYNLSQPRHFCKSCRRYWTKGGVLRNVPVGGGCRKSKRGSSKQKSASEKRAGKSGLCTERKSGCQSHTSSGSESTSGLATATATTPTTASISKSPSANADLSYSSSISMKKMIMNETTSETTSTLAQTYTNTGILNFSNHHPHQKFVIPASGYTVSTNFESLIGQNSTDNAPGGIFPEIGSLMSLMDNTHTKTPLKLQIGGEDNKFAHSLQLQDWQAMEEEVKIQGLGGGILDQTITEQTDLWQSKNNDGGLVGFDWQAAAPGGGHHDGDDQVGLFQLPASVDQSANWSHSCTEWCGNDHPLFLP